QRVRAVGVANAELGPGREALGGVRKDLDRQLPPDPVGPQHPPDNQAVRLLSPGPSPSARTSTSTRWPLGATALTTRRRALTVLPPRLISLPTSSGAARTSEVTPRPPGTSP